jgi:hypothetical protein
MLDFKKSFALEIAFRDNLHSEIPIIRSSPFILPVVIETDSIFPSILPFAHIYVFIVFLHETFQESLDFPILDISPVIKYLVLMEAEILPLSESMLSINVELITCEKSLAAKDNSGC